MASYKKELIIFFIGLVVCVGLAFGFRLLLKFSDQSLVPYYKQKCADEHINVSDRTQERIDQGLKCMNEANVTPLIEEIGLIIVFLFFATKLVLALLRLDAWVRADRISPTRELNRQVFIHHFSGVLWLPLTLLILHFIK